MDEKGTLPSVEAVFSAQTAFSATPIAPIKPNEVQKEALVRLDRLRRRGLNRAVVIAATGVGKTYLAAMDFR